MSKYLAHAVSLIALRYSSIAAMAVLARRSHRFLRMRKARLAPARRAVTAPQRA